MSIAGKLQIKPEHSVAVLAAPPGRFATVAGDLDRPEAGQAVAAAARDALLGPRELRPVRQVAIDDVWSALRFRPEGAA